MDALHLTTVHMPTDTRIFDKEAKSLVEAGFDIGIVAHDAPEGTQDGVTFLSLGTADNRIDRWKNIQNVARLAKRAEADIYHIHDPELLPVGVYLSRTIDSSVIYDVHEDFSHQVTDRDWIPWWAGYPLATIVPLIERTAARELDAVVTVSEWWGEPFEGVADTIEIIHNFPRTDTIRSVSGDINTAADCTLCYVGGLSDVRGIHQMLRLVEYLDNNEVDVELFIIGPWRPDSDPKSAKQFVNTHSLDDLVTFTGYLQYEQMFRYLKSADVGLALLDTTHYKGGIPTKFFEYLYAGLPIITTPVDAVSQFIPPEYRYVVPEQDTAGAAEAVRRAVAKEYDEAEMRQVVEEKYNWKSESEKLVQLYEKLLA